MASTLKELLKPGGGRPREGGPKGLTRELLFEARVWAADYAGRPPDIEHRLDELDREWDQERLLEVGASVLMLLELLRGPRRRRFSLWPVLMAGALLQHGLQGWSPPLEFLRRLKVRPWREIEAEKCALMALRGDFEDGAHEPARP